MRMHGDSAILLHGLGRTGASLKRMRTALTAAGCRAVAFDYPSTRHSLTDLTDTLAPRVAALDDQTPGRLHFVGHSMGGLLARASIAGRRPRRLGHVVMLGPPNRGSEIADRLQHLSLYRRLLGPAALALGTRSVPTWPAPDYAIGVIAGTRTIDPIGWLMLPRPNDGRVSVERTRIVGLHGHRILPVSHGLMMNDDTVIAETLLFLATGAFSPPSG